MDEQFELPVEYKGEQYLFNAALLVYGFSHRFQVNVHGQVIIFEPDEEKNYRALLEYTNLEMRESIDVGLIEKITQVISEIVK